jgi:hypothetical protein
MARSSVRQLSLPLSLSESSAWDFYVSSPLLELRHIVADGWTSPDHRHPHYDHRLALFGQTPDRKPAFSLFLFLEDPVQ